MGPPQAVCVLSGVPPPGCFLNERRMLRSSLKHRTAWRCQAAAALSHGGRSAVRQGAAGKTGPRGPTGTSESCETLRGGRGIWLGTGRFPDGGAGRKQAGGGSFLPVVEPKMVFTVLVIYKAYSCMGKRRTRKQGRMQWCSCQLLPFLTAKVRLFTPLPVVNQELKGIDSWQAEEEQKRDQSRTLRRGRCLRCSSVARRHFLSFFLGFFFSHFQTLLILVPCLSWSL